MNPERAVIGAMMTGHNSVLDVTEILGVDDFYDPRLANVFTAITHLDSKGSPVDPITVADRLTERGLLENLGGSVVLADLYAEAPVGASASYYAKMVRRESIRRRVRSAGQAIQDAADPENEEAQDPLELLEAAHELLDQATPGDATGLRGIGDDFDETIESLDSPARFLPTPWRALNDRIDGFRPGALYIVGARPGSGKSIVGLQSAAHLSRWGSVAFSSLEMNRRELQLRLLAQRGSIHMSSLGRHALTAQDWDKLAHTSESIRQLPVFIDDRSGVSSAQVRAHARAVSRRGTLAAVVVDYLQLVRSRDPRKPRWEAVTEISRDLKVLARDFDVPVIALAQLNRESENHRRPPTMADLRESGSIEQDADVVLLLQRGWDEISSTTTDDLDVWVAKNRHGMTGKISLLWEGHFTRLSDSPWA